MIYPSVGLMLNLHPDHDYKKACFDAYNRWLAQFCATDPSRLIGVAMLALRSVEEGIRELEEAKRAGFRSVMLPGEPKVEDYDHRCYDPLWQAVRRSRPGRALPHPDREGQHRHCRCAGRRSSSRS